MRQKILRLVKNVNSPGGRDLLRAFVPAAAESAHAWRLRVGVVVIDRDRAAVEWQLRVDDGSLRQILGGSWLDGHRIDSRVDRIEPVAQLEFDDLVESMSPWLPCVEKWPRHASESAVRALLDREIAAWMHTNEAQAKEQLNDVLADDCVLVNPWTVERSKEQRLRGFETFRKEYMDAKIETRDVLVDATQPGLFAARRTFACTNIETRRRGCDDDLVFGEVVRSASNDNHLRLRYARVIFDPNAPTCTQHPSKSSGVRFGWAAAPPISTFSSLLQS